MSVYKSKKRSPNQKTLKKKPTSRSTQTLLTLFGTGEYQKAYELCIDIISKTTKPAADTAEAHHILGILYAQNNNDAGAIDHLSKAVTLAPANDAFRINLANVRHEAKQYELALRDMESVLKRSPLNIAALGLQGVILKDMEKYAEAEATMEKALSVDKDNAQVLFNLACTYEINKKSDEAKSIYHSLISRYPAHIKSIVNLAAIYQREDNDKAVSELYLNALNNLPDDVTLNYNLGVHYIAKRKFQEAADLFVKVLNKDGSHADARNNLSICYWELGCFLESIQELEVLLRIAPGTDKANLNLCRVLQSAQQLSQWKQAASESLSAKEVDKKESPHLHVDLAIIAWLESDIVTCETHLRESDCLTNDTSKLSVNSRAYHGYLNEMVKFRRLNSHLYKQHSDKSIHFVGDSHCLSASGVVVKYQNEWWNIKSHLVVGGKAWHLSRPENNRFKQSLINAMENIPSQSTVIFGFGEIDCREDEGILKNYRKKPHKLQNAIEHLVREYVAFIHKTAREYHVEFLLYGTPAPIHAEKIDSLSQEDKNLLFDIIEMYNNALANNARELNIPFLDVHSLTVGPDCYAKNGFHIDGRHIKPKIFGEPLFDKMMDNNIICRD